MTDNGAAGRDPAPKSGRRVRYTGKHPRKFEQKYKELDPHSYAEDVARIVRGGKTPAGTHRPVMVREILQALEPGPGQSVLDVTLGYGGHATELLQRILPGGCLWGLDVDPIEIRRTETRLRAKGFSDKVFKVRCMNFIGAPKVVKEAGLSGAAGGGFDLVLADLGVSSMQLDDPARGFTFKTEAPLDLRLNPGRGQTGADLLRSLTETEFAHLLTANADEPYARGIARSVYLCRNLPATTTALADAVRRALPRADSDADEEQRTRSIRRTFQSLRIAVNDEFMVLEQFLRNIPKCLKPQGRAAILTFHAGEEKRVLRAFREGFETGVYDRMLPEPVRPSPQEQNDNPRSKSARLHWVRLGGWAGERMAADPRNA